MVDAFTGAPSFVAVIVAAGSGTRFGQPKHELSIDGVPLWRRCVATFEEAGISDIVVVGDMAGAVRGGPRRRDSVSAGLRAAPNADWVLVHDAARPLVTTTLVEAVIAAAQTTDATGVIPAVAVTDTLKRVEGDRVVATVDRASIVAVQTPQAFRMDALRHAHTVDLADDVTDDAGLIERVGGTVVTIQGDPENIKITYPEDLDRARSIAKRKG